MEGNSDNFNLKDFFDDFNQVENIFDAFPFNNTEYFEQEKNNFNFFIFPDVDDWNTFDNNKNIMDSDQLLQKITKCEKNYNNIIQNNIIASPTKSVKDKLAENFESNLNLIEGTLPGLIISLMHKENSPVTENFLITQIIPRFEDLRKINGSKYHGDVHKVLKSTLTSSGIFFKTIDGKFYFKEKEAFDYIIKVTEKVLTKNLEKEKKEMLNSTTQSSNKGKKKKKCSFSDEINYKICKVYNILDQMLSRCKGTLGMEKLSNSFKNVNTSIELLQKIGDQNKLIGIMMCFKYFKSIINKYYKMSSKKKKMDSLIDLNKLNEKLDTLGLKIEYLEKNILTKNGSNFSGNTSCISDTIYAVNNDFSHMNTQQDL